MIAFVPGSFDPITLGHLDIIKRASSLYEFVVVTIVNNSKKNYMFELDERVKMIEEVLRKEKLTNVQVFGFSGLLIDVIDIYRNQEDKMILVKGLRTVTDYEYELQMAHLNRDLGVETSFMITSPQYSYVSSSMVKEVAKLGGEFERYVPQNVKEALSKKLFL